MIDLLFAERLLTIAEDYRSDLDSNQRAQVATMIEQAVSLATLAKSGAFKYDPLATPAANLKRHADTAPSANPNRRCRRPNVDGSPCTREAWDVTRRCWQHSDAAGRAKISALREEWEAPVKKARQGLRVKGIYDRLISLRMTD